MPRAKRWNKTRSDKGKKRVKKSPAESTATEVDPDVSTPETSRSSSVSSTSSVKSSGSKISQNQSVYNQYDSNEEYDIIDWENFSQNLHTCAICRTCGGDLDVSVIKRFGLASQIQILCLKCDNSKKFMNSGLSIVESSEREKKLQMYEVNIRMVYAFRAIGKYHTGASIFCGIMNLPKPPTTWISYEKALATSLEKVCNDSLATAVEEAVAENAGSRDLCVAMDGSWQKRGHQSLNAVITATSVETGKVVNLSVLSKFCRCPQRFKNVHLDDCSANYQGTSGGMEVEGVRKMFAESITRFNVRYLQYLGDGDSKAYKAVLDDSPYGSDVIVEKLECVGHVQKRMGTRLRKLVTENKSKKLADGKSLGGKNRLTMAAITKLGTYYGLAIRRNPENLQKMKQDVWATYFHVSSTNQNPMHQLCSESWCKYKQAEAEGKAKEYDHCKHFHLDEVVMKHTKPVFQSLADPELLKKCLKGKTQNVNESVNNSIWHVVPKNTFVSLRTLKLGLYEAVGVYNDGGIHRCRVLKNLGIQPGKFFISAMQKIDKKRIREAEYHATAMQEKIRKSRCKTKQNLEDMFAEAEEDDPAYSAGLF